MMPPQPFESQMSRRKYVLGAVLVFVLTIIVWLALDLTKFYGNASSKSEETMKELLWLSVPVMLVALVFAARCIIASKQLNLETNAMVSCALE